MTSFDFLISFRGGFFLSFLLGVSCIAEGRSFLNHSPRQNKERVLVAAEASEHVYEVYERFLDRKWNFRARPGLPGYYDLEGQTVEWEGLSFKVDGAFCAKEILNHHECGLFVALYRPLSPLGFPVISVKGTTSLSDWKQNIFDRGAFYIKWIFEVLEAQGGQDFGYREELRASIQELRAFMQGHAILCGHSLGGGLAQALALAVSREMEGGEIPSIDVVTFNSLAGQSLLEKLGADPVAFWRDPIRAVTRFDRMRKVDYRFQRHETLPDNVLALNIATQDDLLQGLNQFLRKQNLGFEMRIPTRRRIDHSGSLNSVRGGAKGHDMTTLLKDLRFTYDRESAEHFVREKYLFWSSAQGARFAEERAMSYVKRNRIDERDYSRMAKVAAIQAEPERQAESYRRMLDFLDSKAVKRVLGF